jgi:hypothetical protein
VLRVRAALAQAAVWCDILILHLNVKYCRAARQSSPAGGVDGKAARLGAAVATDGSMRPRKESATRMAIATRARVRGFFSIDFP